MTPRCIVEVRWGKLAGTKAVIEPGGKLLVGRTDLADLAVPHDGKLSGVHFELSWDGASCALKHLGSQTGTLLRGEAISEGPVAHGGWIRAGDTDFVVCIEDHTPPRRERDEDEIDETARRREAERREAAEAALAALRGEAEKEPLYAVLDAARDGRILELLREHVEAYRSLYAGLQGEALGEVAPHLVGPMREDSRLLERLALEGWGKRWGIWCTSRETFAEVRRHWRRFLMVELEETGQQVYFRFYDPWTLRVLWPTCTEQQRADLLQDITGVVVEGAFEEVLRLDGGSLFHRGVR